MTLPSIERIYPFRTVAVPPSVLGQFIPCHRLRALRSVASPPHAAAALAALTWGILCPTISIRLAVESDTPFPALSALLACLEAAMQR
jgi:hypothetical protein